MLVVTYTTKDGYTIRVVAGSYCSGLTVVKNGIEVYADPCALDAADVGFDCEDDPRWGRDDWQEYLKFGADDNLKDYAGVVR